MDYILLAHSGAQPTHTTIALARPPYVSISNIIISNPGTCTHVYYSALLENICLLMTANKSRHADICNPFTTGRSIYHDMRRSSHRIITILRLLLAALA